MKSWLIKVMGLLLGLHLIVGLAPQGLTHTPNTRVDEKNILGLIDRLACSRSSRGEAVDTLVDIGEAAVPFLFTALKDSNVRIRRGATEALGKIGSAAVVDHLIETLNDSDIFVRWQAIKALGNLGDVALPSLVTTLEVENAKVRKGAVEALGKIGSETTIPHLVGVLNDSETSVRFQVVRALVNIGDAALPSLITALEEGNAEILTYLSENDIVTILESANHQGLIEYHYYDFSTDRPLPPGNPRSPGRNMISRAGKLSIRRKPLVCRSNLIASIWRRCH